MSQKNKKYETEEVVEEPKEVEMTEEEIKEDQGQKINEGREQ